MKTSHEENNGENHCGILACAKEGHVTGNAYWLLAQLTNNGYEGRGRYRAEKKAWEKQNENHGTVVFNL